MIARLHARGLLLPSALITLAALTAALAVGALPSGATVKRYDAGRTITESSTTNVGVLVLSLALVASALLAACALWCVLTERRTTGRQLLVAATVTGIPAIAPALLSAVALSVLVRRSRQS
jgi:ABC-type spermidine/putrescine transport system permease subunit II